MDKRNKGALMRVATAGVLIATVGFVLWDGGEERAVQVTDLPGQTQSLEQGQVQTVLQTEQVDGPRQEDGQEPMRHYTGVQEEMRLLLERYGTMADYKGEVYTLTLPASFSSETDVERGLYWAYHNQFSKAVGLDLTPYLGQTVKAHLWHADDAFAETHPQAHPQTGHTRAVLLEREGRIVGGWLIRKGDLQVASLNRREFEDLTESRWGEWLAEHGIAQDTARAKEFVFPTPEETLTEFFKRVDAGDLEEAKNFYSLAHRFDVLLMGGSLAEQVRQLDEGQFDPVSWVHLFRSVKLTGMKRDEFLHPERPRDTTPFGIQLNREPEGYLQYSVSLDVVNDPERPTIFPDGRVDLFVTLVREEAGAPWRIEVLNTHPQ